MCTMWFMMKLSVVASKIGWRWWQIPLTLGTLFIMFIKVLKRKFPESEFPVSDLIVVYATTYEYLNFWLNLHDIQDWNGVIHYSCIKCNETNNTYYFNMK